MTKKSNQEAIIEFNPKLPRLSASESKVLKLLEEAGKKDPAFLSQYTVIEKVNGKLVATAYHVKYAKLLAPIAEKLEKAASITDNREFGNALRIQAKALLTGSYNEAIIAWLKNKPYILDISIGPVDHFDDQLFFRKASYQAWVGIVNATDTEKLNNYKAITLSARRKTEVPQKRVDNRDKVKAKVIDVLIFSGFMARTKFVGVNLPMDVNIVEKYGSEITLFNQPNDLRLKEQILPSFSNIFSQSFREGFSQEDLRKGNLGYIAIHELAHSYLYYRNASKNLKDLFICIYELAATVLGLRMAGPLLLEDVITSKRLESMIVAFICRSFYLIKKAKTDKPMVNRVLGSAIFINFMLENGALKQRDGMVIANFMKIFIALQELSFILEQLLSSGTRKDTETFIKKYGYLNESFERYIL